MIKENIHEDNRMSAKTQLLMFYAKVNGYIMQIRLWKNERQWSVNEFLPCKLGYYYVN